MIVTSERFDPSSLTRHFLGSTALSNAFLWHIEPRHEVYHITVYKVKFLVMWQNLCCIPIMSDNGHWVRPNFISPVIPMAMTQYRLPLHFMSGSIKTERKNGIFGTWLCSLNKKNYFFNQESSCLKNLTKSWVKIYVMPYKIGAQHYQS